MKPKNIILRVGAWAAPVALAALIAAPDSSQSAVAQQRSASSPATFASQEAPSARPGPAAYVPGTVLVGYRPSIVQSRLVRATASTIGLRSEGGWGPARKCCACRRH